ncbi:Uncharacterised protein [Salmonella enterica subsp. enterica]|uniref:Uncharacterized protein n=1 Tax=Salmonella enterica I TaxID=59201 RepID=A0A447TQM9_SALET|nr:Uncharacterised protein [Salmonella enterica subsp. enterica]
MLSTLSMSLPYFSKRLISLARIFSPSGVAKLFFQDRQQRIKTQALLIEYQPIERMKGITQVGDTDALYARKVYSARRRR